MLIAAGFFISFIGSIPPGLISVSVAHTAISRGIAAAVVLASGAAVAEFFQAWIAIFLSDWLLQHAGIELIFRWVSVVVFISLGAYLFFWAGTPRIREGELKNSLHNQFIKGIIVSSFNLLAIPYWFVYCGWLRMEGWWVEGWPGILQFSGGVMLGTISALLLYIWIGMLIVRKASILALHANRLVGFIFMGLGLRIFFDLIR